MPFLAREKSTRGEVPLPGIRNELRMLPAAPNADGTPAWMVHDPVKNRFYRIGWIDFEILLRWSQGSASAVVDAVNAETTLVIGQADISGLLEFLARNDLLCVADQAGTEQLARRAASARVTPSQWLLHHYLFFRVPLLRPQHWLAKIMPALQWVYTLQTALVVALLTGAGIFLAMRQWDVFGRTFVDTMTWSGLMGYAIALVAAKALHELGHALTATHYGVRVAHMGVALVVLFPMLYTDTSETWKLSNPRQRLAIASAGIAAELALAGLATLAWSLAPEGSAKSALFFLATSSWILTLTINVSPFMRFDGYFILCDVLDFPNLNERSTALAKTWMRRKLLGWNDVWPEQLTPRARRLLLAFALCAWLYRLMIFLGIALLVYHYFFKVLGIFLMVVELVWFIGRPIALEFKVWFARRNEIKASRLGIGAVLLIGLLAAGFIPWQTGVHGIGWIHPERQQVIYAPLPGRVVILPRAGKVSTGQLLFVLESPDMQLAAQRYAGLAQARERELVGLAGLEDGEERRMQIQLQRDKFQSEARMYSIEQARLRIASPFAGVFDDLDPALAAGVWVQPRQPLGVVIDPTRWVVDAFVAEADIARVRAGQSTRVHLGLRTLSVLNARVIEVDTSRTQNLPHAMLDANSGGPISTLSGTPGDNPAGARAPRDALYRVRIVLDEPPPLRQMAVGTVVISAEVRAWLPLMFERIAAILVRESGF